MRSTYLLFLLFVTFFSAQGQTLAELKADTQIMYDASYQLDFDKIFDYSYPKLFELATRDQLKSAMTAAFDNEAMKISFQKVNPDFVFSPIKKIDDKTVCVIHYNNAMQMAFKQNFDTPQEQKTMADAIQASGKFKTVKVLSESKAIYVELPSTMVAIADKSTQNKWKFVTYDESQPEMAKQLLGEKTLKELGL